MPICGCVEQIFFSRNTEFTGTAHDNKFVTWGAFKYNGNGSRRVRSPKAIEIGHMTLMFDAMVSRTLRGKKFTRPHLNNALTATYLACIPENCNRFARYGQKTSFYAANFMHLTFLFGLLTAYESLPTTSARQTLYRTTIRDHIKTTTSHKEH